MQLPVPSSVNVETAPPPQGDFEPLPATWYTVTFDSATVEDKSEGKGAPGSHLMVKLTLLVADGPFKGRKVFENWCLRWPSKVQAEEIAASHFRSAYTAMGYGTAPATTDELLHRPVDVLLSIQKDKKGEYGPQNRPRQYAPAGSKADVAQQEAAKAAQDAARSSKAAATPPTPVAAPVAPASGGWGAPPAPAATSAAPPPAPQAPAVSVAPTSPPAGVQQAASQAPQTQQAAQPVRAPAGAPGTGVAQPAPPAAPPIGQAPWGVAPGQ